MSQTADDTDIDWDLLINKARGGCDAALSEILEAVQSYLLLVAESRLGSQIRSKFGASDIVQHSMLEAQESIEDFRGDSEGELRLWLKRIVLNNLTDEAKRYTHTHSRSIRLEVPVDRLTSETCHAHEETPSWQIQRREIDEALSQAVLRLPNRQRYVIEARHRHGCSYAEIASQLEISEACARKLWSRATERLRDDMETLE